MRWICIAAALVGCAANLPPRRPWNEPREQLDKSDVIYGMQQIRPAVGACFDRYKTEGVFNAAFTIVGDGHVTSVQVHGPHVETNDCVGHAVATASFPAFTGPPQSVVYPFMLSTGGSAVIH